MFCVYIWTLAHVVVVCLYVYVYVCVCVCDVQAYRSSVCFVQE